MFSFATVYTAMNLNNQSISFIDNREFTGVGALPGPVGYQFFIGSNVLSVIPNLMFGLNYFLADGLLLYRCYVVYSMKLWVIALPCLMYLTTFALSLRVLIGQGRVWDYHQTLYNYSTVCLPLSVSLNVLLTLMIVVRLVLHSRNTQAVMGSPGGIGGLYRTIIAMLIESSALYAVSSLLVIGPISAGSPTAHIFFTHPR